MIEANRSRVEEWLAIQERLRQLLAQQGSGSGSSFQLIEEDCGTYEQKILVFSSAALSATLVEAVEALLSGYSPSWQVLMLMTGEDRKELSPPTGLRVSSIALEVLPPREISEAEDRDTRELYTSLDELLGKHGKSNAFGDGDYWIVDDSWVPCSHKVCVFQIEFLTPQLAMEVRQLLEERFPTCQVWFQIEVDEPGVPIPLPGIRVFSNRVEQDWNGSEMRAMFKDGFLW
jgi:hypothetical protein